jgi:charged multivesicular body protein 1
MGQKHSLEDDLIQFRLTSKQMQRSSKKCDKNMETQKQKLTKAMKEGNMEGARIYAQNVIREKNQSLNFLRLGSRIDAVASRLETAIRMQDVNKAMVMTVKGMSNAMKSMQVDQIASTMADFEKNFEDMDVRSGYMESTMQNTTSMSTPPEEVDNLMKVAYTGTTRYAGFFMLVNTRCVLCRWWRTRRAWRSRHRWRPPGPAQCNTSSPRPPTKVRTRCSCVWERKQAYQYLCAAADPASELEARLAALRG